MAAHPIGAIPESFALLALMHLHRVRLRSRTDATGVLLLPKEQDRSLRYTDEIRIGLTLLKESAQKTAFSRFHAKAGIAAEHCLAPSYGETRW